MAMDIRITSGYRIEMGALFRRQLLAVFQIVIVLNHSFASPVWMPQFLSAGKNVRGLKVLLCGRGRKEKVGEKCRESEKGVIYLLNPNPSGKLFKVFAGKRLFSFFFLFFLINCQVYSSDSEHLPCGCRNELVSFPPHYFRNLKIWNSICCRLKIFKCGVFYRKNGCIIMRKSNYMLSRVGRN